MAYLVALPPPQYDHKFAGQIIEKRLPFSEIQKLCKGGLACSWPGLVIKDKDGKVTGTYCLMLLPQHDRGTLKRHETGHCNGWPRNHPDGVWIRWNDEDFYKG